MSEPFQLQLKLIIIFFLGNISLFGVFQDIHVPMLCFKMLELK